VLETGGVQVGVVGKTVAMDLPLSGGKSGAFCGKLVTPLYPLCMA
jgi:hypothetical protein